MTVDPIGPTPPPPGVTVWDRKKPERNPSAEVKLFGGLRMPPAAQLDNIVGLEDWIREAEGQVDEEDRAFQSLTAPLATALLTGGAVCVRRLAVVDHPESDADA